MESFFIIAHFPRLWDAAGGNAAGKTLFIWALFWYNRMRMYEPCGALFVSVYAGDRRASSSVGQSWRLITAWSRVQVLAGPLKAEHPACPAGCFAFCAAKRWPARLEQGGRPQPAKTVRWTVFSPRVVLAGPPRRNRLRSIQKAHFGRLFSYRSVIPPSPQKILLRRLSRGPRLFRPACPAGRFAFCAAKRWPALVAAFKPFRSSCRKDFILCSGTAASGFLDEKKKTISPKRLASIPFMW